MSSANQVTVEVVAAGLVRTVEVSAPGPQGPAGAAGPAGDDGREVELQAGATHVQWRYVGDAAWIDLVPLSSLVGPAGPAGAAGAAGAMGPAGSAATIAIGTVTTGAAGSSASVTNTGTSSAAVLTFTIPRGDTGPQGPAGAQGSQGATGAAGADGDDGREIELQTSATHVQWRYVGAATWTNLVALSAITGPAGAAGATGPQGPQGPQGATGATGATGPQGPAGPTGLQGPQGPKGDTGDTGPAGASGATGATGAQGPSGVANATAPLTYDAGTQTVAISAATTSAAGSMSAADKAKLDGVAAGATANATDAQLRDRSTHTGTQSAGTITGLATVATSGAYGDLTGRPVLGTAAATASTDYATATQGAKADTAVQPGALGSAAYLAAGAAAGNVPVLDSSGKIAAGVLPSYVDDVIEGASLAAFPGTGEIGKIYVAIDTGKCYRWSGSAYVEISASPGSTDAVPEGSVNLYFTTARARQSVSAIGSLVYDSSTGVISYTAPQNTNGLAEGTNNLYFTQARARQSINVSGLLTYNSATGVIGYSPPSTGAGSGTVTSVDLTVQPGTGISVSGGPITSSGTIGISLASGYTIPTTTQLESFLTSATAASTYQPLDSDLTAIAALTTTTFGRSLLTQADAATARATLGVDTGNGSVTSVGLSLPDLFSVSGSPVTGSGTLTAALATQAANRLWAGPTTGANAAPTFRSLVAADLGTTLSPQFAFLGIGAAASALFDLVLNGAAMVRHQSVTISGSTYTFDVGVASEFTCGAAINGNVTFALTNHDQLPAASSGVGWRTRAVITFTWTSGTITFSATGYTFSQASVTLTSGQTYNAILTITSSSTVIGVQYTLGRS